jgi:hypothetical protein
MAPMSFFRDTYATRIERALSKRVSLKSEEDMLLRNGFITLNLTPQFPAALIVEDKKSLVTKRRHLVNNCVREGLPSSK